MKMAFQLAYSLRTANEDEERQGNSQIPPDEEGDRKSDETNKDD